MPGRPRSEGSAQRPPFLTVVHCEPAAHPSDYALGIPAFSQPLSLQLKNPVTFLVGENGSGKSTLLEALAYLCGFSLEGGNRNHRMADRDAMPPLASSLRLVWRPKVTEGFLLRAESFYDFATQLDEIAQGDLLIYEAYGGKSLHVQSHGESFLALFGNKFKRGLFLLDEPEAALSPQRQLALLAILHRLEREGRSQFIIATHSPILLAYPTAEIFSLDGPIRPIAYRETDHYQLTKGFLDDPDLYFRHLFADE